MCGTGTSCDRWWMSLYTGIGLQKCSRSFTGWEREDLEECLHPDCAPGHRVPGFLPYFFSLSCSLETLEVPWLTW